MGKRISLKLPGTFRNKRLWENFLKEFSTCTTYWYVPKAITVNDENLALLQKRLHIFFEEYSDKAWNQETQLAYHKRLVKEGLASPYTQGEKATKVEDVTALVRINKVVFDSLGLLWVDRESRPVLTDVGLDFLVAENPRSIIEKQIQKMQFPRPGRSSERDFRGLIPHLFLLQCLREVEFYLTKREYILFVNLAAGHDDVARVADYIRAWRKLAEKEQTLLYEKAGSVAMARSRSTNLFGEVDADDAHPRLKRIELNYSYQRAYWGFPSYINIHQDEEHEQWQVRDRKALDGVLKRVTTKLHIIRFKTDADWYAYFGDPGKGPKWYDALEYYIETSASQKEAKALLKKEKPKAALTPAEEAELEERLYEKAIEDIYFSSPFLLEKGLKVIADGRQYSTIVGRIDLLCRDAQGNYVVVEIKRDEADDESIGQILRYIGWVYQHLCENNTVRGILLAGKFGDKVEYARIGLLKENHKEFLKFRRHALTTEAV